MITAIAVMATLGQLSVAPPDLFDRFIPGHGYGKPYSSRPTEAGEGFDEDKDLPSHGAQAAAFRSWQRLSADGTLPPNAIMHAKGQRDTLIAARIRTHAAGISRASWTWNGPANIAGRVRALVIHPTDPDIMWVGSVSGGIWKTTDAGNSWFPLDDFLPTLAIGCMAIDPQNPNTLYAGTGEGFALVENQFAYAAYMPGAGMFESKDGGTTWQQLGSTANDSNWGFVNRIAICPTRPQTILAATRTGVFRSENAGGVWKRVWDGEVFDIEFDPSDPDRVILGRADGCAAYSNDGGLTWADSQGLPSALRVEVRFAGDGTPTVYAAVSSLYRAWVYRSDDGGVTFSQRNNASDILTFHNYNLSLWVNPYDKDDIIVGGVYAFRSRDGGRTFYKMFEDMHTDVHAIISKPGFDGVFNRQVYFATDDGIWHAPDYTVGSVEPLNEGLGITQVHNAVFNNYANILIAGAQDNGTSISLGGGLQWRAYVIGSDGGYCATNPNDPNNYYGEMPCGAVYRSRNNTETFDDAIGPPGAGDGTKFNLITPLILDPNNDNRLLVGGDVLWCTDDAKDFASWHVLKEAISDVPYLAQWDFDPRLISKMAVAVGNSDIIYVGYNNGQVWATHNGTLATPSWTRLDGNGPLPARAVGSIEIDPNDTDRVFVSFLGWEPDNLWESRDGGATWAPRTGSAPFTLPSAPVNAITMHRQMPNWLYAGTDVGLFTSSDGGATWSAITDGPATVAVNDLNWRWVNTLVCATYGRGVYSAVIVPNEEPVAVSSFEFVQGDWKSGNLTDLFRSDGRIVTAQPGGGFSSISASLEINFGGFSPVNSPSAMKFIVQSRASTTNLMQEISLYDFAANSWVALAASPTGVTYNTYEAVANVLPQDFINQTTRTMLAKVAFRQTGIIFMYPWQVKIDVAKWLITP